MNRYLIECINDCKNEFVVAYAPSMYDDNMSKAADAYELAISIVNEEINKYPLIYDGRSI